MRRTRVISASEIGEYGYCSRAWWYKHVAQVPPGSSDYSRLAAGTRAHRRHGRGVEMAGALRAIGMALGACGLVALAAALLT